MCVSTCVRELNVDSVVGLDFTFVVYNLFGFVCYTIYNYALYFSDVVRREYEHRHPQSEIPVQINDLVYVVQGVCISSFLLIQICMYEVGPCCVPC